MTARDVREFREYPDAMTVARGGVVYVVSEDYYRRNMRGHVRIVMTHPDLRAIDPGAYDMTHSWLAEIITEVENNMISMHDE